MNGATEATLQELLSTAQLMNVNLTKIRELYSRATITPGLNPNTINDVNQGLSRLGPISRALGLAFDAVKFSLNVFSSALSLMGSVISSVISTVGSLASGLVDFTKKLYDGTAKLSDFFNVFSDLPLIGNLASVLAFLSDSQDSLLESYRILTNVGASFSGNLIEMRNQAARAFLTFPEFAKIIQNNFAYFSTMTGGVQQGINQFIIAQEKLFGPNSRYSKSILGLGITTDEAGQYLVNYMQSQGNLSSRQNRDYDLLAKNTYDYIIQLDELSKITGKRRDQIDAEIKEIEKEQVFQTFLEQLDPNEALKARSALATAVATGDKALIEQVKNSLMGIDAPLTEASVQLATTTQGASIQFGQLIRDMVRNPTITMDEFKNRVLNETLMLGSRVVDFSKGLGTETSAVMTSLFSSSQNLLRLGRIFDANGKDIDKFLKALPEEQRKMLTGTASGVAQAQRNLQLAGANLRDSVDTLLAPLYDQMARFSLSLSSVITSLTGNKGFKDAVDDLSKWISTTFKEMEKEETFSGKLKVLLERTFQGSENFWKNTLGPILSNSITPAIKDVWNNSLVPAMTEGWKTLLDFLKPYWTSFLQDTLDRVSDYIYEKTGLGESREQRIERQRAEKILELPEFKAWFEGLSQKQQQEYDQSGFFKKLFIDFNNNLKKSGLIKGEDAVAIVRKFLESGIPMRPIEGTPPYIPATPTIPVTRNFGSLGSTGKVFENFGSGTPAILHGTEAVVTPDQMNDIISKTSNINQNNLVEGIQNLNNLTYQMLYSLKENTEYIKKQYSATLELSGNLWAS